MDKRGKCRAFPTKEQENERVELATNVGSIPIARSTLQIRAEKRKSRRAPRPPASIIDVIES